MPFLTVAKFKIIICGIKHCRYPEDWVPLRTSSKSRQKAGQLQGRHVSPRLRRPPPDSGQLRGCHVSPWLRLPAQGSSGGATCPRGSGSRLRAALGPPRVAWAPAPTFWLRAEAAAKLPRVPWTSSTNCKQLNKYSLATRTS
jgi:hypothetical protein